MRRTIIPVILALGVAGCTASPAPATVSPAPTSTSAATATPTPTAQPVSITITMTGELLWHEVAWQQAQKDAGGQGFDFEQEFASVKPLIEGSDLAICHEEVPFSPPGVPHTGYPTFGVPDQIAPGMKKLGFDVCTTASNHSIDKGFDGLVHTIDSFAAAGIPTTGTYKTAADAEKPLIVDVLGVKVAIIEGAYSTNGIPLPEGKEWSVGDLDPQRFLRLAKAARAQGADIVIAVVHGGEEYQQMPNAQQQELAQILTASPDVDFVFGHHIHHVQPFAKVNGKWVLYGLGNLIAQGIDEGTQESNIAVVTFTGIPGSQRFTTTKVQYAPTYTTWYTEQVRVYWANAALKNPASAPNTTPARLQAAITRNKAAVESLGVTEAELI